MSADLIIADAAVIATVDADRREIRDGWISVENGVVTAIGGPGDHRPDGARVVSARGCLVTPGLINTHHHLYQNLTRAYSPMTSAPLFGWLQTLYPLWRQLDEEAAYVELRLRLAGSLRKRRQKEKLTQNELAKRIGSSQSRVAKVESGDTSVSLDLLIRSLLALGATGRDLAKAFSAAETMRAAVVPAAW